MEKHYLEVIAEFGTKGALLPKSFWWVDEKVVIKQVFNVTAMASTKTGGHGARYTCITQNRNFDLFYDGERWYIEF